MTTKRSRRFGALGLGVTVLVAALSGAASAPATGSSPASATQVDATIVSQWNSIAQAETILLRPTAHGQMRGIAMVQGAVYDAVNAVERTASRTCSTSTRCGHGGSSQGSRRGGRVPCAEGDHARGSTRGSRRCLHGNAGDDSGRPGGRRGIAAGVAASDAMVDARAMTGSWRSSVPRSAPPRATGGRSAGRLLRRSTRTVGSAT